MRKWLAGPDAEAEPAAVWALCALMAATFCVVTTEHLPAGLLPQISSGLGVSLPVAGQLVTGYALTVMLLTVPLTYLTRRIPRRPLLLGLMTLFVLAGLGSAAAPDYALLLASRAVTALVHAVFWAVVTVTATALFSPAVRGRILAMVYGATSMATIVGVPAGSWIGQHAGWRVAFLALSGIGLVALAVVAVFLPATAVSRTRDDDTAVPDTSRYVVLLVTIVLALAGLSMAFTYTVPFLTKVTGFSTAAVAPLLLLRGAAGVASVSVAGNLADRHPRLATTAPVALLSVSLIGMYLAGRTPVLVAVLMATSGLAVLVMITTLTNELLSVAPGDLYIASAGGNAVFNAGTAAGAASGGLVLSDVGVRGTALLGGLLAAAAVAVLLVDQVRGRTRGTARTSADESP
ncbi:MFS transporter [Streptomyces sp. NEAU-sy36]|uniref:MFS transporter n=1 Tax=unclassified Streptomyces TaxID=2593676 RepID=UPI0015D5A3AE|nr:MULTISPECIES: MFS transporter [unclassified Streptomyces]QLJ03535.1 MFS transporter [Streptomyces sp. NEAU-sy36]